MPATRKRGYFLLAIAVTILTSCGTSPTEPESGAAYALDAYAWRDFQPPTPDDRLRVVVTLSQLAGGAVPENLEPRQLEVTRILTGERWETGFAVVRRENGEVQAQADGGPRWPVGEFVAVSAVVEDADGGPGFRLNFARVEIIRTE